jgi:hypothetical protein
MDSHDNTLIDPIFASIGSIEEYMDNDGFSLIEGVYKDFTSTSGVSQREGISHDE